MLPAHKENGPTGILINTKSLEREREAFLQKSFPSLPQSSFFLPSLLPCRVAAQQPERVAGVAEFGEDAGELGLEQVCLEIGEKGIFPALRAQGARLQLAEIHPRLEQCRSKIPAREPGLSGSVNSTEVLLAAEVSVGLGPMTTKRV